MTTPEAIEGVEVTPLRQIRDERGSIMHMLRADSPQFEAFWGSLFLVRQGRQEQGLEGTGS